MKVYKVVFACEEDGERTILLSSVMRRHAGVIYKPNEWVKAPEWLARHGYHLTAFKNFEDALKFVESSFLGKYLLEIWEAEADGVIEKLPPMKDVGYISSGIDPFTAPDDPVGWPKGTIMCKRLKLIKKVWPEEGSE